ncbi:hypothetical protein [Paraoerskovia marina]|uniref:Integral membrane protein n=1 Tax=Paraoerskovia marina TaxID=545619 RepID=A0A1H1QSP2_9CELL|nr:hypothetical protein [Paraoerskovia marina]SDS26333.1 hypothetical protein SAMN04489860_1162 [Paraoerskovia marina]
MSDIDPAATPQSPSAPRSRALTVVLVGLGLEVVAAVAGAVLLLVGLADVPGELVAMTLFLVVCALGLAAALYFSGRALVRGSRRGRAPTITWQIFQVIVGVGAVQSGNPVVGVPLVVVAVAVVVGVLRVAADTERSAAG